MAEPNVTPEPSTPNGAGAEAAMADDPGSLHARLSGAERDRDQYRVLLQRTRADFENYEKRVLRDREQERRYALGPLVVDLLPALDNLDRALAAARLAGDTGPLAQGVALAYKEILEALRRKGITRIEAEGQPFDPNLHQAVMQMPKADVPPQSVVEVVQQGFQLHDRVLRPVHVIVSA